MAKHNVFNFIFLFFVGFNCYAEQALLNDMLISLENKHTQAAFVLAGPVTPKVTQLKNPDRIVIDFPATKFGKPLEVSNPTTSIIEKIKGSKTDGEGLRFIFELKKPVKVRSRMLSGKVLGQQKLILDLLTGVKAADKKASAVPASSALSAKNKGGEQDWKEHLRILNQRFAIQENKIRELQLIVEQQGRLLSKRQQGSKQSATPPSKPAQPSFTQKEMTVSKAKPAVKKEEIKRKAPREKGIETVLREKHAAIFQHGFTVEPGFSYTRTDRNRVALSGFLVLDAIALGKISVDEVESDVLLFDVTSRYGVTDNLQLDINIPFLHRSTTYRNTASVGNAPEEVERTVDLGFALSDINFGFSYQLLDESNLWPDVIFSTRVRTPSGTHPFGIKTIELAPDENEQDAPVADDGTDKNNKVQYPEKLPSGNGLWAVTSGFSFVKSVDPAVIFASLSYTYNIEEDFSDISSKVGQVQPGSIDLGNSYQFGLGFAVALNESMTMSIAYSHRYSDNSRTKAEGGNWTDVVGSDLNSSQLSFGMVYAITPKFSVVASVAAGLTNDAPDSQFSLRFPITF